MRFDSTHVDLPANPSLMYVWLPVFFRGMIEYLSFPEMHADCVDGRCTWACSVQKYRAASVKIQTK